MFCPSFDLTPPHDLPTIPVSSQMGWSQFLDTGLSYCATSRLCTREKQTQTGLPQVVPKGCVSQKWKPVQTKYASTAKHSFHSTRAWEVPMFCWKDFKLLRFIYVYIEIRKVKEIKINLSKISDWPANWHELNERFSLKLRLRNCWLIINHRSAAPKEHMSQSSHLCMIESSCTWKVL